MKEVRLLKLELTNYRNIEHEVYVFGGKNAKIIGENRIGKTNTLEAIYFLLTNYLLDGSSDLTQLKPLDDTTKVVSVKGTFDVWDNQIPHKPPVKITLEKRYCENWVTKRGTTERVLDGHSETYFVNDIEQDKASIYYDTLEEHFGIRNDKKGEIDSVQMICNPLYVGNLGDSKDWTNLRAFIIKLIGDVTNEEIFEAEPTTELIKEDLEKALGKIDQVKKMYENDIKGLKLAINGHDANINMLERTTKPSDEDVTLAKRGIEEANDKINELTRSLEDNSVVKELEKKVFDTKKQVLELNTKEYADWQKSTQPASSGSNKLDELNDKLEKLLDKSTDTKFKLSDAQKEKNMADVHISVCTSNRERFAKEYNEIKKEMADVDKHVQTVCPTCGRPLEADKVEEARKSYLAGLQEKLDYITEEGKNNTGELNSYKEVLNGAVKKIVDIEAELTEITNEIDAVKQEIASAKEVSNNSQPNAPFVESKELKALRVKLADLEKELAEALSNASETKSKTYDKIAELKVNMATLQKVLDDKNYYDRQMEQLERVNAEKDNACKMLADTEQKKSCLDLFNYTKLRLLDTHVAHVFGDIKFQLIRENINGGFDPVCKPYIFDVEKCQSTNTIWKSGSKSEKIVTGIAIAEHIKAHLGLSNIPFLFDEGGEVSSDTLFNRLKTSAQIICVKVEDNINQPVVVNF